MRNFWKLVHLPETWNRFVSWVQQKEEEEKLSNAMDVEYQLFHNEHTVWDEYAIADAAGCEMCVTCGAHPEDCYPSSCPKNY